MKTFSPPTIPPFVIYSVLDFIFLVSTLVSSLAISNLEVICVFHLSFDEKSFLSPVIYKSKFFLR